MKKLCHYTTGFLTLFFVFQNPVAAQHSEPAELEIAPAAKLITGTWQWSETKRLSRGSQPVTQTPATTNRNLKVTFKPDQTVDVFLNERLAGSYKYELSKKNSNFIILRFSGADDGNPFYQYITEGPLTVTQEQLYIAGGYNDAGSNQTFTRIMDNKATLSSNIKKE